MWLDIKKKRNPVYSQLVTSLNCNAAPRLLKTSSSFLTRSSRTSENKYPHLWSVKAFLLKHLKSLFLSFSETGCLAYRNAHSLYESLHVFSPHLTQHKGFSGGYPLFNSHQVWLFNFYAKWTHSLSCFSLIGEALSALQPLLSWPSSCCEAVTWNILHISKTVIWPSVTETFSKGGLLNSFLLILGQLRTI